MNAPASVLLTLPLARIFSALEYSAFNQTINLDRGAISYCRLDFAYYNAPGTNWGIATGFIEINGYKVNFDAFDQNSIWEYEQIAIPTSELPALFDDADGNERGDDHGRPP